VTVALDVNPDNARPWIAAAAPTHPSLIDTTHVIYYLSFITFGLFLTAKSVDSERWRG